MADISSEELAFNQDIIDQQFSTSQDPELAAKNARVMQANAAGASQEELLAASVSEGDFELPGLAQAVGESNFDMANDMHSPVGIGLSPKEQANDPSYLLDNSDFLGKFADDSMTAMLSYLSPDDSSPESVQLDKTVLNKGNEALVRMDRSLDDKQELIEKTFRETAGEMPASALPGLTESTQKLYQDEILAVRSSPTGPEHEAIFNIAPIDTDALISASWELQLAFNNSIVNAMDRTVGEAVLDGVLSVTPGYFHKTVDQFLADPRTQEMMGREEEIFDLQSFHDTWREMPLERQSLMAGELIKFFEENSGLMGLDDKNLDFVVAFAALLGDTRPEAVDNLNVTQLVQQTLGAVGIVEGTYILGYATGTAARLMRKRTSTINILDGLNEGLDATRPIKPNGPDSPELPPREPGVSEAAEVNVVAMMDDTVSEVSGVPKTDAIDNVSPFVVNGEINPNRIPGLGASSAKILNDFIRINKEGTVLSFTERGGMLKAGMMTDPETKLHLQTYMEELTEEASTYLFEEQGLFIDNLRAENVTANGFEMVYDVVDLATGLKTVKNVREKQAIQLNDINGNYDQTAKANLGLAQAQSPSFWARSGTKSDVVPVDFAEDVVIAIAMESVEAAARKRVVQLMQDSYAGLRGVHNTNARKRVSSVLRAGDRANNPLTGEQGIVYTPEQLKNTGIQTEAGDTVYLRQDKELEAYYKALIAGEAVADLNEMAAKRLLDAEGAKRVSYLPDEEDFARVYDKPENVARIKGLGSVRIYDPTTLSVDNYSAALVAQRYAEGYKLVNTIYNAKSFRDGQVKGVNTREFVDFFFVRTEDISPPKMGEILHRKPGWVPDPAQRVEFLVKENIEYGTKNGRPHARSENRHYLSNEADGAAIIAELRQKGIEKITADRDAVLSSREASDADIARANAIYEKDLEAVSASDRFQIVRDRELTDLERVAFEDGSSRGLITRARSRERIMYGLQRQTPESLDPLEAMSLRAQQMANMNVWDVHLMSMQKKWMNSYENLVGGTRPGDTFYNLKLSQDTQVGQNLEFIRNQIKTWTGIRTNQENALQQMSQEAHNWALGLSRKVTPLMGFDGPDSVPLILSLKHSNPIALAKAATHHLTLGALSIQQLFMQAQGATNALALFPTEAPLALTYTAGFPMIELALRFNRENANEILGAMSKELATEAPLFKEVFTQYMRTGYSDAVNTNADMQALQSGVGGSLRTMGRALSGVSNAFYSSGEKFNRRYSFTSSYLNWKKKNPDRIPTDQELISVIMDDANTAMLKLGKNNKAMIQGGANTSVTHQSIGLATMYWQVPLKTMGLMVKNPTKLDGGAAVTDKASRGKTLDFKQKMGMLVSGLAIYGLAAVGIGPSIIEAWEESTGEDFSEQPEAVKNAVQGGASATLVRTLLGADVLVETRFSLATSSKDFLIGFATGKPKIGWSMLGAAGNSADRVLTAVSNSMIPVLSAHSEDRPLSKAEQTAILLEISELFTSTRYAMDGYILSKYGVVLDTQGGIVLNDTDKDYNTQTEWALAMGFPLKDVQIIYETGAARYNLDEVANQLADTYIAMMHKKAVVDQWTDESRGEYKLFDTFMSKLTDEYVRNKVLAQVSEAMFNPQTKKDKELAAFFERRGFLMADILRDPANSYGGIFLKNTPGENISDINDPLVPRLQERVHDKSALDIFNNIDQSELPTGEELRNGK